MRVPLLSDSDFLLTRISPQRLCALQLPPPFPADSGQPSLGLSLGLSAVSRTVTRTVRVTRTVTQTVTRTVRRQSDPEKQRRPHAGRTAAGQAAVGPDSGPRSRDSRPPSPYSRLLRHGRQAAAHSLGFWAHRDCRRFAAALMVTAPVIAHTAATSLRLWPRYSHDVTALTLWSRRSHCGHGAHTGSRRSHCGRGSSLANTLLVY